LSKGNPSKIYISSLLITRYGTNTKRLPKIRTLWELILEPFEDKILQILLVAATVSLIIGVIQHGWSHGWIEGTSIYLAVTIITAVTAGNNYIKEKQFQKLVSKAAEDWIPTFRGNEGLTQTLSTTELVVGDLVKLEAGNRIPADCLLIESTDFAADESSMTGEPEQVEKSAVTQKNFEHNPSPFLLGNTLVVSGSGSAIVCAVGVNTRSGMAEEKLNIEEEETPLQAKLETIANEIGRIGVYVALLTFISMTVKMIVVTVKDDTK
jgi:P-type E1-E2 ATPase